MPLANNHSLDYGYGGLLYTLNYMDKSGIDKLGVGKDYNDAIREEYYVWVSLRRWGSSWSLSHRSL